MKADGGQKDAENPVKWLVSGVLHTFSTFLKGLYIAIPQNFRLEKEPDETHPY
jgi:hypothetical protein